MILLLIFSFVSGLVTILAPCIWPLLPVILSASINGGKTKSFGIVTGIMASFTVFTLSISYIVRLIPFDPDVLRFFAVIVISFFGLTLIIPKLNHVFEQWMSMVSRRFSPQTSKSNGFIPGFMTGFALGLVWSPCAGAILATIAALSATRAINIEVVMITISYVLGVGIPLFIFSVAGSRFFAKTKVLSPHTGRIRQIFGVIMILTAIAIYTNFDKVIQIKLLSAFPSYSDFIYKLENNPSVKKELDRLQKTKTTPMPKLFSSSLPQLGRAPEFAEISKWLNSDPLTMESLKGKVVLIDFWTYTCINCIRTLPYVTGWYEKYKDKEFVVVGVHTPEFEFEKKTENVENAIKQYGIHYPIAQDNDYQTWEAYSNHYWPAKYLIDAKGYIRYSHFGEGKYEETEMNIKALLDEMGMKTDETRLSLEDQTPRFSLTPETYLGTARRDINGSLQLERDWKNEEEYIESKKGTKLKLRFYASKVFLVITPKGKDDEIKVLLDGKIISEDRSGKDLKDGKIQIDKARLYNLVDLKDGPTEHYLELDFESDGTRIYAFTFG